MKDGMKDGRQWIVAASRTHVYIVEHRKPDVFRVLLHEEEERGRLRASEIHTDGEGMVHDPNGQGARYCDPPQDPTDHIEEEWARSIADSLRRARSEGQCQSLVLVAEPGFLGTLRNQLDEATHRIVDDSIPKRLPLEDQNQFLSALRARLAA